MGVGKKNLVELDEKKCFFFNTTKKTDLDGVKDRKLPKNNLIIKKIETEN